MNVMGMEDSTASTSSSSSMFTNCALISSLLAFIIAQVSKFFISCLWTTYACCWLGSYHPWPNDHHFNSMPIAHPQLTMHHSHHHHHPPQPQPHPLRAQSLADPQTSDKLTDDKSAQCTVTCVYHAKLVDMCRTVTFVWCKNLINHSLYITVDCPGNDNQYFCKIDFKPWHFWTKKGFKPFDIEGKRVDIFWDLRSAKFSGGPEPYMDYYVALVFDEEVVLLLGDYKKKAYKRTKSRPSLVDAVLVYKKENVFGKKCFSTRAKFDQRRKDHDIVVENSLAGPREPEMWISVDGIVLIHITNLHWKFRGNETVLVDKMPVQVFWDVHDWLFGTPGSSHGLFIFKPGAPENYVPKDCGGGGGGETDSTTTTSTDNEDAQQLVTPSSPEFSLFLYAWKLE